MTISDPAFSIAAYEPFPNLSWWGAVASCDHIRWDAAEHFQKMTYRNRYLIASANGMLMMSIPLVNGRNQRVPMDQVLICDRAGWQQQHWRTLVSAYNRSPYFEHYAPELETIFLQPFERLADFNRATVVWARQQLGFHFSETVATMYVPEIPDVLYDLRKGRKPSHEALIKDFPQYHQVFDNRHGFLPNLSILDLLFCEGPAAARWLNVNKLQLQSLVQQ